MNKHNFYKEISEYLKQNNWVKSIVNNEECFYKKRTIADGSSTNIERKKRYDIIEIKNRIVNYLDNRDIKEFHYDTVVNPYSDSDFVVAALQYINRFLYGDSMLTKKLIYSFQPVIRPIPAGENEQTGFLHSFINVGTVGVLQEFDDYCMQLEMWIDILSACHIYISRIGLKIKNNTNIFEGVGLEITVDGYELGQLNYYEIEHDKKIVAVTDMGFGLERIAWAANNWKEFATFYQSPEAYYLGYDNVSDIINMIVFIISSGVKPGGNGVAAVLRKQIRQLVCKYLWMDYGIFIKYAVTQTHLYLNCNYNYEEVKKIFDCEMDRAICLEIRERCKTKQFDRLIGNSSSYCGKLLDNKIYRNKC